MKHKDLDDIQGLIVNNQFLKAFEALERYPSISEDALQLHRHFNQLEKEKRSLMLDSKGYWNQLALISKSLFSIIDELKQSEAETPETGTGSFSVSESTEAIDGNTKENSEKMFQTIGDNREPVNLGQLNQAILGRFLLQMRKAHSNINGLQPDQNYLPTLIRILVDIESNLKDFNAYLASIKHEKTKIGAISKSSFSKTKEVLKEISQARREMSSTEAREFIRSYVTPYYNKNLESLILELNELVEKFSKN